MGNVTSLIEGLVLPELVSCERCQKRQQNRKALNRFVFPCASWSCDCIYGRYC